ncbi:GNAT family N-acetyltransferase [Flavobacteriaceae bacterium S356]|uniref:GNAT family N-acetyltransferase n=1 Tax=Asprobacillus argus TaxID=3076534 RepID=A0ABU3LCT9_9FLAO|nr:GNAT family N-acetyltransferase [Flavobacteriaceae bacterium S356]
MMKISETIYLKSITEHDLDDLRTLMDKIYHPAYINYWKDKGDWYVSDLYNEENLHQELQENEADYFFILLKDVIIGIMRTVWNLDTNYQPDKNYVKLHRLYIDQEIQNKGIGKKIMSWLIKTATEKGYKKLWLEVMEKQHQAVHFYKKLDFTEVDKVMVDFPLLYDNYRGMYKMVKELKK